MVVVLSTTWNAEDIIAKFLRHYLKLGASGIIVTDYGSTDSTLEILRSVEWKSFVRVLQLEQLKGQDTSNDMLRIAKWEGRSRWALFCDPDEFLITPNMKLDDLVSEAEQNNTEALLIKRFNMTALKSKSQAVAQGEDLFDVFSIRISRQYSRSPAERSGAVPLSCPWIFSEIGPKTFCNLSATTAVPPGNHYAVTVHNRSASASSEIQLLHFPFRTFEQFGNKLKLAVQDFAVNDYPGDNSWQYKLWFQCVKNDSVREEYTDQFVNDDSLPRLIADGSVCEEMRLAEFSRRLAGSRPQIKLPTA